MQAAATAALAASCGIGQRFINFGQTPESQMWVNWASTSPSSAQDATVMYGTSPSALSGSATGTSVTYTFKGGYTSPYLHHALLDKLAPGTTYYYQVGGAGCGFSATANFTTSPGPSEPMLFAIMGDLGQTSNSADTLAHIAANPAVNAIMHIGDLSYADSDETRWDSWQSLVEYQSSHVPWQVIVGNHEIETDKTPFLAYNNRFYTAAVQARGPGNGTWYSLEAGMVHWVFVSGYETFTAGSPQYAWLQADLASVNRKVTPWLVVVFHEPYANSNYAHQGEGNALMAALESLFDAAGTDLVFSGHVHAYERSYRMRNMKPDATGPYYITIGDGGNREGLASSWISPQPAWSAFRQASYGHGELQTINATHMHWTWHQNPDLEPKVADELWIVKGQQNFDEQRTGVPTFVKGRGPQ